MNDLPGNYFSLGRVYPRESLREPLIRRRRRFNVPVENLKGLEQEGFRFRSDDGSETTATWVTAQDTNISRPNDTNTRLRIIVNASTIDPASKQYMLQYRRVGNTEWKGVR